MTEEASKAASELGLQRVREILFGEILVELERRLSKLEAYITSRSNDLQHDARQRTDVVEAHLKKEVEAVAARNARDTNELTGVIREARHEQHDAFVQLEQRIVRLEERLEGQVARIERESREQVLAVSKGFFEELVLLRSQLRIATAHDEEEAEPAKAEGSEHAAWDSH